MNINTVRTKNDLSKKIAVGLGAVALLAALASLPGCSWLTPNDTAPATPTPIETPPQTTGDDTIRVTAPRPNEAIDSPFVVEGEARGTWFFEASFPIRLEAADGQVIGTGLAQALDDWMTEDFVRFRALMEFDASEHAGQTATLILQRDNPSGLPEHDRSIELPVILPMTVETTTVQAYFGNNTLDPAMTCVKVFPVERRITKTPAVGRAALLQLLAGPTMDEQSQGYFSSLNHGIGLKSLSIVDGVAHADFDEQLEFQVGGSCRVGAIRAQITATLKQFPTVDEVIISINGRTEDILQP
ncbi:MAG: GerMN domain-containing protein [Patescibacteria group bacterium]